VVQLLTNFVGEKDEQLFPVALLGVISGRREKGPWHFVQHVRIPRTTVSKALAFGGLMQKYQLTGMYFDELEVGQEFVTPRRTITETDVILFSGLSGDYNPLHTDAEYAKGSVFGERIVQGLLGLAMANGLFVRLGIEYGTTKAFLDLSWTFKRPIRIGDTIYARVVVSEKRESKSKTNQGIISLDVSLFNQRNEIVQKGRWVKLVGRK
jgi:acyl dehydratase